MNEVPISDSALTMTQSAGLFFLGVINTSISMAWWAWMTMDINMTEIGFAIVDMWVMVSLKMVRFTALRVGWREYVWLTGPRVCDGGWPPDMRGTRLACGPTPRHSHIGAALEFEFTRHGWASHSSNTFLCFYFFLCFLFFVWGNSLYLNLL